MMHDIIVVGVQLVAIVSGTMMNRRNIRKLRTQIYGCFGMMYMGFDGLDARIDKIEATVADLNALTGSLIGRVETIEKRG